ncbi:amino acid permease 6-like protein [Tanacetum coccineum]
MTKGETSTQTHEQEIKINFDSKQGKQEKLHSFYTSKSQQARVDSKRRQAKSRQAKRRQARVDKTERQARVVQARVGQKQNKKKDKEQEALLISEDRAFVITRENIGPKPNPGGRLQHILCAIAQYETLIGDTLRSSPPENKVMKTATTIGISASTSFYMLCGLLGYAAFGNNAPGNYLTGFGFYEPFWLVDIANLCIVIHLVGAYQEYAIGYFRINLYRVIWRSTYVLLASLVAMIFPFFNEFLALIGSTTFWPLSVYFPIEMYLSQTKIRRNSLRWISLKILSLVCLVVSLLAAAGSIRGLLVPVQNFKLFQSVS